MKEEIKTFKIVGKDKKTTEYEVLFTFDNTKTNKSYIIFTDNKKDKDGNIYTYASTYTIKDDKLDLKEIENQEEWDMVESILSQIEQKMDE